MKKGSLTLSGNQIIESGTHDAIFTPDAVFIKLYDFEIAGGEPEPEIVDDTQPETEAPKKEKKPKPEKPVVEVVEKQETKTPETNLEKFGEGEYTLTAAQDLVVGNKAVWVVDTNWEADKPDYLVEVTRVTDTEVVFADVETGEEYPCVDFESQKGEEMPEGETHLFYVIKVKL